MANNLEIKRQPLMSNSYGKIILRANKLSQLAQQYACSVKTIQRKLDSVKPEKSSTFSAVVNVVMDTTYFGKTFGVMVFKDSLQGQILLTKYVKQETNKLYIEGIEEIGRRRITIQAIICNGRKGGFTTI